MLRRPVLAMTTALAVTASLAGAAATSAAASGASAGPPAARVSQIPLTDAAGDVWLFEGSTWELWGTQSDADVLTALVDHRAKVIKVVLTFDDLKEESPAVYLAKIYTKKMTRNAWVKANEDVGWEGVHSLTTQLGEVDDTGFKHEIDYEDDTVTFTLPRKLFDKPAWIKALMRNDLKGEKKFTDNPHNDDHVPAYTAKIFKP